MTVCIRSVRFGAGLQWSEEGCRVVSTSATRTECACSHLTSFAILMHPSQVVVSHRGVFVHLVQLLFHLSTGDGVFVALFSCNSQ